MTISTSVSPRGMAVSAIQKPSNYWTVRYKMEESILDQNFYFFYALFHLDIVETGKLLTFLMV